MARLVVLQIATRTAAAVASARLAHPVLCDRRRSPSSWCVPVVRWLSTSPKAATGRPVAGRFGRDRRNRKRFRNATGLPVARLHHFRIAYGSCQEAKTTVEILVLSGRLDRETGRRWWADLHRVGGPMLIASALWGLMKSLQ